MESSLAFMDDLLDFSSDIGEEDEEEDVVPFNVKPKAAAAAAAVVVADSSAAFHPDGSSCRVLPVSFENVILRFLWTSGFVLFFLSVVGGSG